MIAAADRLPPPLQQRKPWLYMIAVNLALMAALVVYKYNVDYPVNQFSFLLATYEFGFMKRALLGSIIALFEDRMRIVEVFILALAVWLVTMALFVILFKRTFGFAGDRIQLFVFAFGSPFFFKNFFHTFGFLDIYGCLFAIVVLLIPVNRLFPLIVGLGTGALVLVHHLHFLLYVPVIAVVAVIRFLCLRPFSRFDLAMSLLAAVPACAAFVASTFFGTAPIPPDELLSYFRARSLDPLEPFVNTSIWYTTIWDELAKTIQQFPRNAPRLPVYFALIALHWPLFRFMRALYSSIAVPAHRTVVVLGIVGITAAYVVIFVFVYDYGRWFSSWVVCMILLMHALAMLQARDGAPAPPFATGKTAKPDFVLAWIVTALPRVGLQIPF